MKVLFDQGTPAPLRKSLSNHEVFTAYEQGWSRLKNGELIAAAEQSSFNVFVTTDKNLKYQQNLTGRSLAIIVLLTTSRPRLREHLPVIVSAVNLAQSGSYQEISVLSAA